MGYCIVSHTKFGTNTYGGGKMQQKDYFKCSNENKTLHLHDISSIQYDIMNIKMKFYADLQVSE